MIVKKEIKECKKTKVARNMYSATLVKLKTINPIIDFQ